MTPLSLDFKVTQQECITLRQEHTQPGGEVRKRCDEWLVHPSGGSHPASKLVLYPEQLLPENEPASRLTGVVLVEGGSGVFLL